MMLNQLQYSLCLCVVINFLNVTASPWASPSQEILDELNDAEIYKAVVHSMDEWQRRQNAKKTHARIKRDESAVCYPDLGCFEASGPFGYLDMLPSTPEEIDTKFLMYPGHGKRRSGNSPGEFPSRNLSDAFMWAKQGFNNSLPTKVMIHGFGSDCSHIWIYEMRSALMAVDEVNVICVDWGNGATLPNYVKATANTRLVGKQLALLIKGLIEHTGMSLKNMHLIGFSLGAHVAGFAGAELGNLSRITGLDPAGPLFESQDPRARLDQTDAGFVDVIHSNGENLILGGLGSWQPMGHVDFYPNGGRMQKGCSNIFVGAVSDIIWSSAVEGRSLCNHRRAYKFFTDSVSPRCHFPAFPCESYEQFLAGECFPCTEERKCGNMGYYADRSKGKGQLYLITRDEEPFCAHQYHIKIENTPGETPIVSYGKLQVTLIGDSLLNETFILTKKEDDEMKLGSSVSRIVVPHPILLEPSKIQIVYHAYSGWLTSGLAQWRIDKITLSDSFGKSSSVCQKNLVLESGVPVTLPLYPGECNLPKSTNSATVNSNNKEAEDRYDAKSKNYTFETSQSKFVPPPSSSTIVKAGTEYVTSSQHADRNAISLKDAIDIFNLPWSSDKGGNGLDNEAESSRAFNTRVVKMTREQRNFSSTSTDDFHSSNSSSSESTTSREVVEPILKPHATKIGRSHDPTRDKHEITEPILGPTTARIVGAPKVIIHNDLISKLTQNDKEIVYNFYDIEKETDWIPAVHPSVRNLNEQWKQEEESKLQRKGEEDAFNVIVRTVQFLPQRLARMFEEAEKYARETILPLVSTYTPKFISDFITPKETTTKYLPLSYEIATEKVLLTTHRPPTTTTTSRAIKDNSIVKEEVEVVTSTEGDPSTTESRSNIQKIQGKRRNKNKFTTIIPITITMPSISTTKVPILNVSSRSTSEQRSINLQNDRNNSGSTAEPMTKDDKIYIDLPVFNETANQIKYIPLHDGQDDSHKPT